MSPLGLVGGKLLRLFDCLGDMVCDADTDVEIATIDLGASWQVAAGGEEASPPDRCKLSQHA